MLDRSPVAADPAGAVHIALLITLFAVTGAAGQGLAVSSSTRDTSLGACNSYEQCGRLKGAYVVERGRALSKEWGRRGGKAVCNSSQHGQPVCALAAAQDRQGQWDQEAQLVFATAPNSYSSANPSDTGGVKVLAPAGAQGDCSSCTAFAVVAAAQTAVARVLKVNVDGVRLSVQDLFFCSSSPRTCTSLWDLPSALQELRKRRLLQPDCLPYSPPKQARLVPQGQLCTAKCKHTNSVAGQGTFDSQHVPDPWSAIAHILTYGSVISRFDVYDNFRPFFANRANKQRVYKPGDKAKIVETHAVLLVGFDMEQKYWLAQNSWSVSWGDQGLFKLAFGTCGVLTSSTTEAYAVFWAVKDVDKTRLKVTTSSRPGCYVYQAVAGDYLSAIADKINIPLAQLLSDNTDRIKVLDAPLAGISLLLCTTKSDSLAIHTPQGTPTSSSSSACPVSSGRRLLAGSIRDRLDDKYRQSRVWRDCYRLQQQPACAKGPSSLC